jgi:hypothetical protein
LSGSTNDLVIASARLFEAIAQRSALAAPVSN